MSNDALLQKAVLAELKWEPSVTAAHIGVSAEAGVVTLTGHVRTYAEKLGAEEATRRVRGVKAVVEKIEVRPSFDIVVHDDEIATAAVARLDSNVAVPHGMVKVEVESGVVTLSGEVEWHYQRAAAEHDVRNLRGVKDVINLISIKPAVDVTNLSDEITHALHRSWFFDPKTINVTARGGIVHLSGTVLSPHERQVAAATAWSAPGVTDVENAIVIS